MQTISPQEAGCQFAIPTRQLQREVGGVESPQALPQTNETDDASSPRQRYPGGSASSEKKIFGLKRQFKPAKGNLLGLVCHGLSNSLMERREQDEPTRWVRKVLSGSAPPWVERSPIYVSIVPWYQFDPFICRDSERRITRKCVKNSKLRNSDTRRGRRSRPEQIGCRAPTSLPGTGTGTGVE